MDTIFALASARGRAGVSVVRVSGPAAFAALNALAAPVEPRQAAVRTLTHAEELIDQALVLRFPKPASFTGEDVVEFQLHGSVAVVGMLLRVLSEMPGLRLAEEGEFTRRALLNDRLDISQVEGLADLIDAETEAQRRQAVRVFSGDLGALTERWRRKLIRAAALLEATIDFADEDVPTDVFPEVRVLLQEVSTELSRESAGTETAERVRSGFEVALVGPPNVGKSSLLNALAGRQAAITSNVAGTTRDVIEVAMDLRGIPVSILDTAGIRDSSDAVEKIGIERALGRAESADLRVILDDGEGQLVLQPRSDDIVLITKSDLHTGDISVVTGEGIDFLIDRIASVLEHRVANVGVATRERHRVAMSDATAGLNLAIDLLEGDGFSPEIAAENLRYAVRSLDVLVGRVGVEDILDDVFSSFCIGK